MTMSSRVGLVFLVVSGFGGVVIDIATEPTRYDFQSPQSVARQDQGGQHIPSMHALRIL